ncbi:MAG TPA: hypothetical protein VE220_00230 [Gaiellaceae bacterium]|nr:hypothetical protein [Gaiellaceae bacterium]
MGVTDWFRRLFSPSSSPNSEGAEDDAVLREEYGEGAAGQPGSGAVTGGVSGFAGLEDAEAAEAAVEGDEPTDPAP